MGSPPNTVYRIYHWINILSLDVVAGALAGGIMAWKIIDTSIDNSYWIILASAVWLIYTADHLIDGFLTRHRPVHSRHSFHWENRKAILMIMVIMLWMVLFVTLTSLPRSIIIFGLVLGTLCAFYLAVVLLFSRIAVLFQKEILVAILYTAGIWGPLFMVSDEFNINALIAAGIFALLAFNDLLLLSIIELKKDMKSGQRSFPSFFGAKRSKSIFRIAGVLIITSSVLLMILSPLEDLKQAGLIMIFMQLLLFLIFYYPERILAHERYRYFSEAIFLLPALMLL